MQHEYWCASTKRRNSQLPLSIYHRSIIPLREEHRPPPIWHIGGLGRGKPTRLSSKSKSVPGAARFHKFWGDGLDRQSCLPSVLGSIWRLGDVIFWTFSILRPKRKRSCKTKPQTDLNYILFDFHVGVFFQIFGCLFGNS